MRKVDVNLDRDTIKLKIKQLLKPSVIEEKPLMVEFITNILMSRGDGVKNFLLAEANQLDKEYYPVGTVVQIPFKRVGEYWSTSRKDKMLESPDDFGVKGESIQGIVVDVYPFSSTHSYTILYKGLSYSDLPEDSLVELESSDVKIYEYE
jgi:hypothetical protein